MGDFSFPKQHHLTRQADFSRVFGEGRKKHSRGLIFFSVSNAFDHPRLGISIGRRIGKSVLRNRLRRRIREAFRQNWRWLGLGGTDVVVVAKRGAAALELSDIMIDFKRIFSARSGKR